MTIAVGDRFPETTLPTQVGDEVKQISLSDLMAGKRVVLFGLPGAYTGVCSSAHLPSFIRTAQAFRDKGVDHIVCLSVNDVRVMNHWGQSSGAHDAGILMLADWNSEVTKAMGLDFTVPAIGFRERCTRCAMLIEDGVVKVLQFEKDHGVCTLTAGETLLDMV